MHKVIFVEGYNDGNPDLEKLNQLLKNEEWFVKSVTGVPRTDGGMPIFAFVLEDYDS